MPLRYCDVCFKIDEAPRHVVDGVRDNVPTEDQLASLPPGPPSAGAQLMNPNTRVRHIDCCAAQGCEVCQATEALTGGARDDDLLIALGTSEEVRNLDTTGMVI
jgi:hypothetical protein